MAGPVLVLLVLDGFGALKGMWRMVVVVDLAFRAYPFASTAVGALGGFVTGSGTSSSVLFGRLQVDTAVAISVSPQLLAAANIMGAGIGKMICPQSIAIGSAAAGLVGAESRLFKAALPWFVGVLLAASVLTGFAALALCRA